MMNKKEIFRKVGGILNELNEQYDYLSQNPENLHDLELELFAANANFLSDHISILVKLNGKPGPSEVINEKSTEAEARGPEEIRQEDEQPAAESAGEAEAPAPESDEEQVADEAEPEYEAENSPETEEEVIEEAGDDEEYASEIPEAEPEKEASVSEGFRFDFGGSPDVKAMSEQSGENTKPEPAASLSDREPAPVVPDNREDQKEQEPLQNSSETQGNEPEVVAKEVVIPERTIAVPSEQINTEPKPTLNDLLSPKSAAGHIGTQFGSRQPKDLKSMISLNDKLLFVRDLFNGYSLAYSEAIELLNRFDTFESAQNFLNSNYAQKNNWEARQETAEKLFEILQRRYSS